MSIEPVGIVAFLLGLVCLAAGPIFTVYALLVASLLQSAAALVFTSLGGASIQPAHLLLLFLLIVMSRYGWIMRGTLQAMRPSNPGFWLVVLLVYGVISAIFLPRLFEGVTYTFGNSREGNGSMVSPLPLMPTTGNITQAGYFVGDVLCFLVVAALATRERYATAIANGVLFCCCADLAFAALDQVTALTGTTVLMAPIRNASYRMLDDGYVMGIKRLVGTFPETSAYAFVTLGLFGFSFSLWLRHDRPRLSGTIALLLLTTLMLSTSSTAYAGSVLYLGLVYVAAAVRMGLGRATRNMSRFVLVAPVGALVLVMLLQFSDAAWRSVLEVFDDFLFNKLSSASGIERAAWNRQAIANAFDTYGLGAGLGSVKSSSFLTSSLGNVGVTGLLAFAGFFATMLVRAGSTREKPEIAILRHAAASGCVALLVAASISGGSIDLGLLFCVLAGLACASSLPRGRFAEPRAVAGAPLGAPRLAASEGG